MSTVASNNNQSKYVALVATLAIHIAIALLFMLFMVGLPDPPLIGTEGMVVNLGYVDESTGDIQPMSEDAEPIVTKQEMQKSAEAQEKIITQAMEETQAVKTAEKVSTEKNSTKTAETPIQTEEPEEEPKVNANAMYKGKNTNSTSQGNSNKGSGDQGDPNGDPNSKNYGVNTGNGDKPGGGGKGGTTVKLTNRKAEALPTPQYNSQDEGKVVVEIIVDQKGNVIKATAGIRGSTTTSTYLLNKAKEAALRTKFNANPDSPDEQRGTIEYNFLLK